MFLHYRKEPLYTPVCGEPELITFTQATLYFPLLYLALLFLPTIIYVEIISSRKYGLKKVTGKIVENTVFSIFAVVTNISFFKLSPAISSRVETETVTIRRSQSVPNITNTMRSGTLRQRSRSMDFVPSLIQTNEGQDPSFSIFQSNIMYSFYFFGTTVIFCLDLGFQMLKNGAFTNSSLVFFGLFLCNMILWIDFNLKLKQQTKMNNGRGIFEDLMDNSSDILMCVLIAPLYWCSAKVRLVKNLQRNPKYICN